eukprot:3109214-Pleurochrysis_carterae.AAC.6
MHQRHSCKGQTAKGRCRKKLSRGKRHASILAQSLPHQQIPSVRSPEYQNRKTCLASAAARAERNQRFHRPEIRTPLGRVESLRQRDDGRGSETTREANSHSARSQPLRFPRIALSASPGHDSAASLLGHESGDSTSSVK